MRQLTKISTLFLVTIAVLANGFTIAWGNTPVQTDKVIDPLTNHPGIKSEQEATALRQLIELIEKKAQTKSQHEKTLAQYKLTLSNYTARNAEYKNTEKKAKAALTSAYSIEAQHSKLTKDIELKNLEISQKTAQLTLLSQNETLLKDQLLAAEEALKADAKNKKTIALVAEVKKQLSKTTKSKTDLEKNIIQQRNLLSLLIKKNEHTKNQIEPSKKLAESLRIEANQSLQVAKSAQEVANADYIKYQKALSEDQTTTQQLQKARQTIGQLNQEKARQKANEIVNAVYNQTLALNHFNYSQKQAIDSTNNHRLAISNLDKRTKNLESTEQLLEKRTLELQKASEELEEKKKVTAGSLEKLRLVDGELRKVKTIFDTQKNKYLKSKSLYDQETTEYKKITTNIQNLENQIRNNQAFTTNSAKEIAKFEAKIQNLKKQIQQSKKEPPSFFKQIQDQMNPPEVEITKMEKQIKELRVKIATTEKRTDQVQADILKLKEKVSAMTAQIEEADKKHQVELIPYKKALDDFNQKQNEYNQHYSIYKSHLTDENKTDTQLKKTENVLAIAKNQLQAARNELQKAKLQFDSTYNKKNQSLANLQTANEKLVIAKENVEKLNSNLSVNDGTYDLRTPGTMTHEEEMRSIYKSALWSKVANSKFWTDLALAEIRSNKSKLDKAKDIEKFCPGYWSASLRQQNICWLRLVGALVKKESSFNPDTTFPEPDTGRNSVGLMQLSANECEVAHSETLLKYPVLNLSCAIRKMANLIEKDKVISGKPGQRGASTYWSSLREPYEYEDQKTGKVYKLGKIQLIQQFTVNYREF